jgi:hypothetical protein
MSKKLTGYISIIGMASNENDNYSTKEPPRRATHL